MRPLLWKRVFLQFPIYFFAIFNSKGLNCKRDAYVLRFFTSTWAVGGGGSRKKQNKKNKRLLPHYFTQYFTRLAEQRTFWHRNRHRAWACPLPQCFSLSETWMLIFQFIIRNLELLHVYMSSIAYWSSVLSSVV